MNFTKKHFVLLQSVLLESSDVLLSRAVTSQVPSTLKGLTSVFGKGRGGTPSPLLAEMVSSFICENVCAFNA